MYQSITITGRLGKDPEMKYMPNGKAVTSFNVATSRKYKTSGGESVEETVWFRVSTFDKQAESCAQYLKKGALVLVVGRLQCDPATGGPRTFTRTNGTSGASFEVTAETVRFLSGKTEESAKPAAMSEDTDYIPF